LAVVILAYAFIGAGTGLAAQQAQDQANAPAGTEQAPQPAVPVRVRVSQGVSQGLLITKVQPKYPKKARKKGIQGTVVLHALISKAGDIATVELVSGDPLLAPAAIDAVKQWKYKPYLLQGKPVDVDTQIVVNFTLTEN
jgi:periplasmic protein TonB